MKFYKATFLISALIFGQAAIAQFKQAPLPYAYNALERAVDAETMEIHYSKHGAGYTSNLNKAIAGSALEKESLEIILGKVSANSELAIRNNAGGHYNHELFWTILTPNTDTKPTAALTSAINKEFGSLDALKEKLNKAGADRFGSGWAWLAVDKSGKLFVSSTANQDNPLMGLADQKGTPILGIDVWEHAYYLKYQNKRADYLSAFWTIVNWPEVSRRYDEAIQGNK